MPPLERAPGRGFTTGRRFDLPAEPLRPFLATSQVAEPAATAST